ncbi:hypothetical protein FQA39_LY01694 [Lamprigera yunnana]|nr:hypothetical protein FQA39_LY01694 [Lamprigera yunnana]
MFTPIDYIVFFAMLSISALIGIYFGYFGKQEQTSSEYLLGSKKMTIIPVTISLITSNVSGVTLLAIPSDVYLYGLNYVFASVAIGIACILTCYLYVSVILKLTVPNAYEYLNLRFNKHVRLIASFLFILQMVVLNSVVSFLPSIAFSQVTGIDAHLITPIVCGTCVFYTTVGGFKAVIWTDVFQFGGMIVSLVPILWLGIKSVGGVQNIWTSAVEGGRLDLDFGMDPTVREGFWSIILGGGILWLNGIAFHPGTVQKYLSIANPSEVKKAIIIMGVGIMVFVNVSIFFGILMYASYKKCDPLSTGQVLKSDQILPFFVSNLVENLAGLSGLFIAGIFSAALSTLSSSFNTLAAAIYGDFIKPFLTSDKSERTTNNILKVIVMVSGVVSILLTFVIEKMGTLLAFVNAAQCCVSGLLVGLFSLGMIFPAANSKGALWGTVISGAITSWVAINNQRYKLKGAFNHFVKPLSVEHCDFKFNATTVAPISYTNEPFVLYRLSYWYNAPIATIILIFVGLIVSWLTKKEDSFSLHALTVEMFATPDYVVCFFMLGGSAFIGIYFGYLKKQEKTIDGYLLGSKKMKIVPVAISLMATHLSGLTLLALPSDVYLYGSHYAFVPLVIGIVSIVNCYLFLPVILKLNVPNGFEYLNMRFNRQIRLLSSLIFVVQIMVFNPLVAYIPAIAFSQVSGVNARLITPVVCGICVFYTTIGGFKAVVWTDVFQFAGMVGSVSAIMWLGIKSVGGLQHMWQDALKGGRLEFNFDPTVREGFWPIILGGGILWLNIICFHPSTVQKYLSVANPWDVKKVILLASFGIGFVKLCCIVIGIMLFSKYKGCDPLTTGQVVTNDQLLAHFIMNLDGTIPGLGGLFLTGVFSAASSTLSSSFNTLAATIYGDFIIPYVNFNISHNATNFILKTIVVVSGIISIALTFVVEKLGSLLGFSNAALSCVSGLLAGLFLLGMLFPMANSKGALWGTIISATVSVWITSVHQWYKVKGAFDHFIKPLSIEECDFSINFTRASTLSSSFNTLAATIYGDFIIPYVNFNISHNATNFILKTIVVVSGIISIALTFVVEKLGSLLGFSNAALSCVSGLLAGLFLLGMLFPMANSKGALWGTIISATVSVWITSVHQWYKVKGAFDHFIKPLSIEECDFSINFTRARPTVSASQPFILYRLSFWYNSLIATFILIVVGLIVSWCTKDEDEFVDPELISPISQFLITRKRLKKVNTNECTAIGAHVSVTYKCNNNDF